MDDNEGLNHSNYPKPFFIVVESTVDGVISMQVKPLPFIAPSVHVRMVEHNARLAHPNIGYTLHGPFASSEQAFNFSLTLVKK